MPELNTKHFMDVAWVSESINMLSSLVCLFLWHVYVCLVCMHICACIFYMWGTHVNACVCACVWRLQVASGCLLRLSSTSFIEEESLAVVCWYMLSSWLSRWWKAWMLVYTTSFKEMWTDVQRSPKFNNRLLKSAGHWLWDTLQSVHQEAIGHRLLYYNL